MHKGCAILDGKIGYECSMDGCRKWKPHFTLSFETDIYVPTDVRLREDIFRHEKGHLNIYTKWYDQLIKDAERMESYSFETKGKCEEASSVFAYLWKMKLVVRGAIYDIWQFAVN